MTPFIIGISGGSGSGKTHFLQSLTEAFSTEEICLISQDNYYKPLDQQLLDSNGIHNFDLPQAIDAPHYVEHILALRNGKTVEQPEYSFNNPHHIPKMLTFHPAPILVVEGIFVFYFSEIARLLDMKIFIDTKEHLKLKRRIIRDNSERGYDLRDVLYRYENHAAPSYEKYIEPYKAEADLIIPNNLNFSLALEVLTVFLRKKIESWES
jgi:uridine kinase